MQNSEVHRQNEGPIHSAFLHNLAFSGCKEATTRLNIGIILAPFGRFQVPSWRPPKWSFSRFNIKWEKWRPRSGLEKTWFVDWFLMPKWEAWNGKNNVSALYFFQIRRFRRSGKLIEKGMPKVIQNEIKIEPWAIKGQIFEIWGVLGGAEI